MPNHRELHTLHAITRYVSTQAPVIEATTTTTTTTTTEKQWTLYMGNDIWYKDDSYTYYDGEAYWARPNSGWDSEYGYGLFTLSLEIDVTPIANVTQLKVVVDFQVDMHEYNPSYDRIRVELIDSNYNTVFDESSEYGVMENNEFIFDFTLESGTKVYELMFDPYNDCRIKGIYFR